ncbi:MAG: SDR family oxidoreductase [Burkholderiaceae bacterium]
MVDIQNDARPPRAVLITGAAKRLGREIALGMARSGWDVLVHYHRSADEAQQTVLDIRQLGRQASAVGADLADPAEVAGLFEAACTALPSSPLRAVVNNASIFRQDTPADFTPASFQLHLGPNLAAPMQLAQRLYQHLGDKERGVVVNILDQKLDSLNPDFFSYTLTKHGLLGATRMMAQAFAPQLRVVGVSPGLTLPSYLQDGKAFDAAHQRAALLDHSSRPEDIVAAVVFLASQPAITGVNLTVDGGQHLMGLNRDVSYLDFSAQ